MPCAAASSSMPTMCAVLRDHRLETARGEGGHRHMVFLVGGGRQAVDARRMRQRLVLGRQRRRGDVRDHEARVQARGRREEGRQARDRRRRSACAMRRSAMAPISAIASASASAASATGSAWKLPPDSDVARPRRRPAGCRSRALASRTSTSARMAHLVEAGAHHLRLAAQAVRVLHAVVALEVRARGSRCRRAGAVDGGDVDLARLAAHGVDARVERARRCPGRRRASSRPRRARLRRPARRRSRASSASAVETCVPLIRARPSLGPSVSGAMPARRSAWRAGSALAREAASRLRRSAPASGAPAAPGRPRRRPSPATGMTGTSAALAAASSASMTSGRTPE